MQMLLMNPRRRKRKAKASHRRRARRSMTAKQLKYFGPRRKRSSSRSRAIVVHANPIRRSRRRRSAVVARRRFRRNPVRMAAMGSQLRASLPSIMHAGVNAAVGGAGAVAADVSMGYLLRALPADIVAKIGSRYDANGNPNLAYYGVKLGMAVALGVAGAKFLPGRMKGYATKAAGGALTVGAYEVMRLMLPANIALGYYSAAPVQGGGPVNPTAMRQTGRLGVYTGRRLAGMGASFPAGSAGRHVPAKEMRVGEGDVE